MKKFFLGVLSSFVGAWLAILFLGIALVIIIGGMVVKLGIASSGNSVKDKTIVTLELKGVIEETARQNDFDFKSLAMESVDDKPQRLDLLVQGLNEAAADDRVKALYIKCKGVSASPATLDALRSALEKFKQSKKRIIAYGDYMMQADYYLASLADSIFINPEGMLQLSGVSQEVPYMATLFHKLGISFQIAKVGTYKSAVEPYILDDMSEPARLQIDTLCNSIWSQYKEAIAKARDIKPAVIDSLTNRCLTFSKARNIVNTKLFDATCYEREMDGRLADIVGQEKDKLNFVEVSTLAGDDMFSISGSEDHIAVVYATGEISEQSKSGIDCYTLVPLIMDLAEDEHEHVKGLVLRVNSPGGSVFGSEQIGDALSEFKKTGKPFAVSMGDYAASGGYWISCEADRIFANPMTVTGSIGIFGVIPNGTELMKKIGVSLQGYSTNPNGALMIPFEPLNESQMAAFTKSVQEGYDQFVARVAKGRKLPEQRVRQIAEGRVYDGKLALGLKLVDELGGLESAIKWTAKKAGLEDEYYKAYPNVEFSLSQLLEESQNNPFINRISSLSGNTIDRFTLIRIQRILTQSHIQARIPYMRIRL